MARVASSKNRPVVFAMLLGAVAIAPLPLGAVYQWSWAGLASITGTLLLFWCLDLVRHPETLRVPPRRLRLPISLFCICVGWAAIQASGLTPSTWDHPIWLAAANTLNSDVSRGISLSPYDTRSALLRLLTYGVIFWLTVQYCRSGGQARRAIVVLATASACYAIYGLAAELSGSDTLLWLEKKAYRGSVTATFVNRNIYAAYAGMGALCVIALWIKLLVDGVFAAPRPREAWYALVTDRPKHIVGLALSTVAILSALLLTGSRGGVFSTAAGLAVFLTALAFNRQRPNRRILILSASFLLAGGILFFALAGAHIGERVTGGDGLNMSGRLQFYEATLGLLSSQPWLGHGYGTFQDIFFLHHETYSKAGIVGNWSYAHNLYLELAIELGIPAAIALIGAVGSITISCLGGARDRRRDATYPALGLGATVLVGVHGLVDIPVIAPAVAATYSVILGVGYAQSWGMAAVNPPLGRQRVAHDTR